MQATLAKIGDYEYYTSYQRIGSFIDYSEYMKYIEYYSFKGYSLDLVSYETNYKKLKKEIEQFLKHFMIHHLLN